MIFFSQAFAEGFGLSAVGFDCIDQHNKGLFQLLQFLNDPFFTGSIFLPWQVGNAAVCGDDQPNGCMFCNDFLRADFCRHAERNFFLKPRRFHHAGHIVFNVSQCTWQDVTHTIHHPNAEVGMFTNGDFRCFFRNKFRFCGHNGFSGSRLRQFIDCSQAFGFFWNIGNDQLFHELFNQRRFSGSDRADNADINITASTFGDVLVNIFCHSVASLRYNRDK